MESEIEWFKAAGLSDTDAEEFQRLLAERFMVDPSLPKSETQVEKEKLRDLRLKELDHKLALSARAGGSRKTEKLRAALEISEGRLVICPGPEGSQAEAWIQNGQIFWYKVQGGKVRGETFLLENTPMPYEYEMFGWIPAWHNND